MVSDILAMHLRITIRSIFCILQSKYQENCDLFRSEMLDEGCSECVD
jgi:hypothetical protein